MSQGNESTSTIDDKQKAADEDPAFQSLLALTNLRINEALKMSYELGRSVEIKNKDFQPDEFDDLEA